MASEAIKKYATISSLIFVLATIQCAWLLWFFYTGLGGALELVAHVMSIALALQVLFMYQQDYLYKWLPPFVNHILVAVYLGICALRLHSFLFRVRAHRHLCAGLVHPDATTSSDCWSSCW